MAKLIVKKGYNRGVDYRLTSETMTIGRGIGCEIRLKDNDISRNHALLSRIGEDAWMLTDLNSRNGTRLNGRPIQKSSVCSRDEIQVGNMVLVFLSTEDAEKGEFRMDPLEPSEESAEKAAMETMNGDGGETQETALKKVLEKAGFTRKAAAQKGNATTEPHRATATVEAAPPKPHADAAQRQAGVTDQQLVERLQRGREALMGEIRKVIVGQGEVLEQMTIALFSRGHCLVVGVPGLAKTLMVSTLARVLDLEFKRIQFTPDLMPSDITGTDILEDDPATRTRSFKFVKGPVFTNILLADEINRTPPKTQAALLEAMQEYKVTAAGYTYNLPRPFFVLATQNPIEQEGTYPLPEAQLDRFMFNVFITYPKKEEEVAIVKATTYDRDPNPKIVLSGSDVIRLQSIVRKVPVSDHVINYATNLVRASRPRDPEAPDFINRWVSWGAGPRAAQYLVIGAKARALLHGRFNVSCSDIRALALPVLRHRIFTNFNADSDGVRPEDVIAKLIEAIPEPSEKDYQKKK
jgi:MoxR-like ATPase